MAQLKGIAINNFRVFKAHTQFDFAPITILTGPNSSGKSSLFKALLMLADSAKKYRLTELDFTGESHYLGNFEDVLNSESGSDTLTFDLDFTGEKDILFGMLEEGFALRLE
jgi:AAA15 family ATPase/GTPase